MRTVIAYIAHTDRPGMNVYLNGMPCMACDPHYDPMQRRGVACQPRRVSMRCAACGTGASVATTPRGYRLSRSSTRATTRAWSPMLARSWPPGPGRQPAEAECSRAGSAEAPAHVGVRSGPRCPQLELSATNKETRHMVDDRIPPLVSATAAAERLGVTAQRVRQLAAAGHLPGQKVDGAGWVFRADTIARAVAARAR